MRWRMGWAGVLCAVLIGAVSAQTVPITTENAARVQEIARLGRGVIRTAAWSPDGSLLAVATTLGVWVESLLSPSPPTPLPQGARGEIPTAENTERFNLREGELDELLDGQTGASSVAFSPDGRWLVSGGDDGSVVVWEKAEDFTAKSAENAEDSVLSGDEELTAKDTEHFILSEGRDARRFVQRQRLEGHLYAVTTLAFSPAGELMASTDASGIVRVWAMDGESVVERAVWEGVGTPHALTFSPDGHWLTAYSDDQLMVWSVGAAAARGCIDCPPADTVPFDSTPITLNDYTAELVAVLFEADDTVTTIDRNGGLVNWTLDGRVVRSEPARSIPAFDNALSPDGRLRATGGDDSIVRVFDAVTGEEITALHGHIRAVTSVAFNPAGDMIASGSLDGTIRLWNVETGAALAVLTGHTSGVTGLAFNVDGSLLASSSYDGTARVWGIQD